MARKRDLRRLSRGLRFRLTASYALFFTLLLVGVAMLFRERLDSTLRIEETDALNDQWAAMKGYLRIEKRHEIDPVERAFWYYDKDDPDEIKAVYDIKDIYLIADAAGKVIFDENDQPAVSPSYKENVGIDSAARIQAHVNEVLACRCSQTWWATIWNS
ncbi:MAG TPA: hypothetical protein VML19_12385, partial [Verrucomicrobiae bacterium]|nr:hypothetical protein [Verrucomicrobiae bacterium]